LLIGLSGPAAAAQTAVEPRPPAVLQDSLTAALPAAPQETAEVEGPQIALAGVPFAVTVRGVDTTAVDALRVRVGEALYGLVVGEEGALVASEVVAPAAGTAVVEVVRGGAVIGRAETRTLPGWAS